MEDGSHIIGIHVDIELLELLADKAGSLQQFLIRLVQSKALELVGSKGSLQVHLMEQLGLLRFAEPSSTRLGVHHTSES